MIPAKTGSNLKKFVSICTLILSAALLLNGCASEQFATRNYSKHSVPYRQGPKLSKITGQPLVRVRVAKSTPKATISATSPIRISPSASARYSAAKVKYFVAPVTITRKNSSFIISAANGARVSWHTNTLRLTPTRSAHLTYKSRHYPRSLVLNTIFYKHKETKNFNIVNYLALENYIPGVIAHELYGSWDLAAFKAQAVAARSYAIYEINLSRNKGDKYDLTSTASSQVYGGKTANQTALKAAHSTRGQVLVYKNRVLPAFYSSTSGGRSQDVTAAMPKVIDIAPLRARKLASWGKASSKYRWGPIYRKRNYLAKRIAAWGKKNDNPIANLRSIKSIKISARSASGRPAQFAVQDKSGRYFLLACERFRFACDYNTSNLPKVKAIPSSDFDISVRGNRVSFTNGRGFGHGVGMSQWGAQGMAKTGRNYRQILSYYYPGAKLKRVY